MTIPHPATDRMELATVLAVLGDPTRLAILGHLARNESVPQTCSRFTGITSKTNLTYHLAKMREAGIVNVEPSGTARLVTLRRDDLEARFPGLLDSILRTAVALPLPERPAANG